MLRDSYKPGSRFRPLRYKRSTQIHDAFAGTLNYERNEAVFIFCRLNRLHVLRAILVCAVFGLKGAFDVAVQWAYGLVRENLWAGTRRRTQGGRRARSLSAGDG